MKLLNRLAVCGVCAVMLTSCAMPFHKEGYNKITKEMMQEFSQEKREIPAITSLDITSEFADFEIIASDKYAIEYSYYYTKEPPELKLTDGVVSFSDQEIYKPEEVYEDTHNYLKIYVPSEASFSSLKVKKQSGDCSLCGFFADKVRIENLFGDIVVSSCQLDDTMLSTESGNIEVALVTANHTELNSSTGEISIKGVTSSKDSDLIIQGACTTIHAEDVSVAQLYLKTDYGDATAKQITADTMDVSLTSGNFSISDSKILNLIGENQSGTVNLDLPKPLSSYAISVISTFGKTMINGIGYQGDVMLHPEGLNKIKFTTAEADITMITNE